VLCDEIYEHLVYGDARFVSLPVVAPELGDRWIVVNGVAKSYAMTGWRIGWMIAAPDVMNAAINYQSQTTSNISNISQRAAIAALTGDLMAVAEMRTVFDRRRRTMTSMLNAIDGVTCVEPEGAFYCFPNVSGLLGRSLAGRVANSSAELAEVLLETIKIAVVPGEAFGTPGFFRLSYALGDDDLVDGLERLSAFVTAG
jgi:aspartate/methionine/tyrosine aminotransferase